MVRCMRAARRSEVSCFSFKAGVLVILLAVFSGRCRDSGRPRKRCAGLRRIPQPQLAAIEALWDDQAAGSSPAWSVLAA